MQPNPILDPVAGRVPESRIARGEAGDDLAAWGATPARPVAGTAWFNQYSYHPATLSNGLTTDREWYAMSYTSFLIRGFCDMEVVSEALADEGVFPVGAQRKGDAAPKAMATIWLNIINDSVCGAYNEVVLSFDVNHSSAGKVAFREGGRVDATWALQYGNFGPSVCDSQFLHSLWIDSPLSISWGREMQAFPKHPKPVSSVLSDQPSEFTFDLSWDGHNVMKGRAAKRFGTVPFLREGMGLVAANGLTGVSGFLAAESFDIPITMPVKTAAENNVPRHYVGHLWKGRNPYAVQVWPWASDDVLDLGDVTEPTGCEDHNGHNLLKRAGFEPVSVTYVPRSSALVELLG
ncbi:MAG: hypothetical protein WCP26_12330 [Actinomycetes bacterium]